jgi:Tol biopolymer transport system component
MARLALVLVAVLLTATACATGTSRRSVAPVRTAVVYAKGNAIWRVRIDGSHPKKLRPGSEPALSPDGRWIAFDRGSSLFVMPAAGGPAKRIYTARGRKYPRIASPTWAPDSRHIAFRETQDWIGTCPAGGTIVVLDTVSHRAHALPSFNGLPSTFRFSPNSRKIAFELEFGCAGFFRSLYVAPTRGGKPVRRLTPDEKRHYPPSAGEFDFSPDSRKIVYSLQHFNGGFDLYVVSARGGAPLRLTHDRKSFDPVWGRPGIAFFRADTERPSSQGDIWLSDGTSHRARKLTRNDAGTAPYAFSADGKTLLAFGGGRHTRLWRLDVATGDEHPFTPSTLDIYPGGFSADGSTVLVTIGCGESDAYIETIPVNGRKPHVVARGPCDASWNAGA